jgi:hypothetical protein
MRGFPVLGPRDPLKTPKRLLALLPVLLLCTFNAKADMASVTASVYVDGTYAFANNGYGIPPYGGLLNGQAASFYCIDFNHDISGNTSWSATVTSLISGSYSKTLLNNPTVYLEMAYLITQMMATSAKQADYQTTEADYQWAIWSLSVGNNPSNPLNPEGMNAPMIGKAQTAVAGNWTPSGNWEILTPRYGSSPQYPYSGYGQEFMVMATPEPSSVLLLLTGLAALAIIALRK